MSGTSKFLTLLAATHLPITLLHRPCCFLHRRSVIFARTLSASPSRLTVSSPAQFSSLRAPITTSRRQFQSGTLPVDNRNSAHASSPLTAHPWPEWFNLIEAISASGQAEENGAIPEEDAFVAYEQLPHDFVRAARQCLTFARQRPNLLGSLSKRDIEIVVSNGTPFLFRTALETACRIRAFLGIDGNHAVDRGDAHTIDIMKYIISYASNPAGSPGQNPVYSRKLLETSIRNILQELVEVGWETPAAVLPPREAHQFSGRAGETPRFAGQNIVMKRGDWICPKCNFMNFARNLKCLECEEPRLRRQLTGGEWECPKCDFLNYGRNVACLRCDSKRPAEASFSTVNNNCSGNAYYRTETRERFSNSEEKAQKWFSKANDASGLNDTSADGDIFPEMIMPLRKEENKSVMSTIRKTPLERRLANSQYKGNSVNSGFPEEEEEEEDKERAEKPANNWFKKMQELHDDFPETVQTKDDSLTSPMDKRETNKDFVPFVPFPPGFFATKETHSLDDKLDNDMGGSRRTENDHASHAKQNPRRSVWTGKSLEGCGVKEEANDPLDMSEEAKTERWFRRVSQIKDISELSQIPDEDFPSIMPMRKGVNRFVVSKRKTPLERRLMSSQYKRNLQAVSSGDFMKKENDVNETE